MVGLEPTMPCARNTWACRYPTSRLSPVRTVGFEPRYQASPCTVADRARAGCSGSGDGRILVSGSLDRRSTVSATNPNKKPDVAVTPGFQQVPLNRWPSVTIASGAGGAYSPVDRRHTPRLSVRECNSTTKSSCLASPPQSDRAAAGVTVRRHSIGRDSTPAGSREFPRSPQMI